MDIDIETPSSRDSGMGSIADPTQTNEAPEIEFYDNYTEIVCDTVSSKLNKGVSVEKELIKRQDDSEFRHTKEKWTKLFSLNSQTILCVSIQGDVVELKVKHLFHSAGYKTYEALKEGYSGKSGNISQTKKYLDHSSDLIHEAVLQKIENVSQHHNLQEFCLYYSSKDFKAIY